MPNSKHPLVRKKTAAYIAGISEKDILSVSKEGQDLLIATPCRQHRVGWREAELIYADKLRTDSQDAKIQVVRRKNKVKLAGANRSYTVNPHDMSCTCPEYKAQQGHYSKHVCSHGYAVLETLGFTTLREFLGREKKISHQEFQLPNATNPTELVHAEAYS